MKFKKVLISSVALLMLSTAGAGIISSSNVNASSRTSKITYLQHRRARDFNDITSINKQLAKLQGKKTRGASFFKNTTKAKKAKHHEPAYMYYFNHRNQWFRKYMNSSHLFRDGVNDGDGTSYNGELNADHANNGLYHKGWIVGYAAGYNEPYKDYVANSTKTTYRKVYNLYNQGVKYAKQNHLSKVSYSSGIWEQGA